MIRIPDNTRSSPLTPGAGDPGPDPTRIFGNRSEQFANQASVQRGVGGVSNPNAGAPYEAAARAFQQVGSAVISTLEEVDGLRAAEEDGKAKLMFLEIEKRDAALRNRLEADPEFAKKTTTEQADLYALERDIEIDKVKIDTGLSHKRVVKNADLGIEQYKTRSGIEYHERVIKPRVVTEAKINDQKSDGLIIDTVTLNPTPENVAKAAANIVERYGDPRSYAIYGAHGAVVMREAAIKRLEQATLTGFQDTIEKSPIASFTGGEITAESAQSGEVSMRINDQKFRFGNVVAQLPLSEQEKALLIDKGNKYIDGFAKKSISDHNAVVKQQNKERLDAVQDQLDTWSVHYGVQARQGQLTERTAYSEFQKLINNPAIMNDPQAVKKAYLAYDKVSDEISQQRRHSERLASERKTRQTIAEMRINNDVAVSGGSLDQVWKKNGTLDSFFANNNMLKPEHLDGMAKAGAVPTSVIGSIRNDLANPDPQINARGIVNLMAIKNHSSKAQQALYKELPDEYAGVINRLDNGQSPKEALAFLTRPRQTPDVEKKLRSQADAKKPKEIAFKAMKEAGFDSDRMSIGMQEEALDQWRDAYSRAGGDEKLASDLFRQDLAKNRTWGVSKFSDKIEKYPLTNFTGSKDIATALINKDFPETVGKEVFPVYGGIRSHNGEQVPTYDIYIKGDDGLMKRLTDNNRVFYTTKEELGAVIQEAKTKAMAADIAKAEKARENDRVAELRGRSNADALKNRPLMDKFGDKN
ncbi:MAG: hypothetical protein Q7V53_07220 [Caldisericota bacterium]|nr:hypothetical protein [Caldisericota bacterium]